MNDRVIKLDDADIEALWKSGEVTCAASWHEEAVRLKELLEYEIGAHRFTKQQLKDLQSKPADRIHTKCLKCRNGAYVETSQHDDMDGVLHCDKCGHRVDRYAVSE